MSTRKPPKTPKPPLPPLPEGLDTLHALVVQHLNESFSQGKPTIQDVSAATAVLRQMWSRKAAEEAKAARASEAPPKPRQGPPIGAPGSPEGDDPPENDPEGEEAPPPIVRKMIPLDPNIVLPFP
jgi:hypothetical protein